ncbi:alpha/beta hydrolase [Mycobacterium sp. ACS4331]|uniref:alpha/beta hydrolase n=1 Tax=Mycobacterium sp. ACS4331 TaxID=1834121 RepID=UPI001E63B980|nr:alpha/beta hydrolase [Mycobacterium sp. ACS4331]
MTQLQPDVQMVLDQVAALDAPPLESLPVEEARAAFLAAGTGRPPGPEVGEVVDGTFPGPAGELDYRLYRPATPGPHAVIVYYHAGGWVLGETRSDDPLCRDLCDRTGAIVVSLGYRHAPEHRFPAVADDAFAGLQWVAKNAADLGGRADQIIVAGWSAGGGTAAVVAQLARDAGGPQLAGQALLTPVTDSDTTRPSYVEYGTGYGLDTTLMQWCFEQYADPADRTDPRIAPLQAKDLRGLAPAVVVTAECDVVRDEGTAYAEALSAAGVPTTHIRAEGHNHLSLSMVDIVASGAPVREQFAAAIRALLA